MNLFLIFLLAGINLAKAADLETLRTNAKRTREMLDQEQETYQNEFMKLSQREKCLKLVLDQTGNPRYFREERLNNYVDNLSNNLSQFCESNLITKESLNSLNVIKANFKISKDVKSLIDDYFLFDDSVKAKLVDRSWNIIYKNLMMPEKSFKGEKTIFISENSEYPWGANYRTVGSPGTRYEITHIDPERQFEKLGISIGSTITKINDVQLSKTSIEKNYKEFRMLLKRGDACTLTFKSNQFALLQHQKSKELLLKTLSNDEVYDEYVTNVQTYLEKKQWQKAYAPWYSLDEPTGRFRYALPINLHRTLQHNLVDFIDVNEEMLVNNLSDALRERDVTLVKKLISRGAKVDANGLRSAVYGGSADCTQLLLEANPKAVNEKDVHNSTPLLYAVSGNCSIECAAMLIKFGANLKASDKYGCTALEKAINNHGPWYYEGTRHGDLKEYIYILALAGLIQKSQKKEYFERFKQN